jgi:acetyl esterase
VSESLDPQVVAYLERLEAGGAPPVGEVPAAELRRAFAAAAGDVFGPVEPVASVEDRETGDGIGVRIYRPVATEALSPALVYFHGGGWVNGSPATHDGIVRALARHSGRAAVSVDYRLAPEHPFPAGLDDAWSATRWVAQAAGDLGIDTERIAVAGDSSGGTLAAVVAHRARDTGLRLDAQALICPVLDCGFDTLSYQRFATGYGVTRDAMRWYWAQYLGDADGANPEVSPLRAEDLTGLPPAVLLVAGCDPLRDEGLAYAKALGAAGVEVTLLPYEGMIHNFVRLAASIDRAAEALADVATRLA